MKIKSVMIAGSGTMGAGIAQIAAQAGCLVFMKLHKNRERGMRLIEAGLDLLVDKGRITPERKAQILSRIRPTLDWNDAAQVDFVIESVAEDFEIKRDVFRRLDTICPPEVIFATNTSSIRVSKLAETTMRPGKFVGLHFFNPVPAMRIVEVVKGDKTDLCTVLEAEDFIHNLGKETVRVKDVPGFLVNRMNLAFRCEAYNCLSEGVADIEDIDKAARLALGLPMGPFELADLVGLDVGLNVIRGLYEEYHDLKWRPNMLLEQLVSRGDLGRKTGRGWYEYASGKKKPRRDIES